ncbi:unnamed protein product [Ambrosiozyma monospora]|uniref:Unnamed protein product n=1 Tax=Ambrosiozyma monospora TaxID=43982 RepID=A0ACB5SVH4_AMBMO|nr:unnamed protein product [Ambrosiozyma monospora]
MDAGFKIFTVSAIMAIWYVHSQSGLIPLVLSLSPSKLSSISKFSVGLLISTAFTLILPEGLEHTEDTSSTSTGVYILLGFVTLYLIDQFSQVLKASSTSNSFGNAFSDNDTSTFNIDDEDQERTFTNHPNSPRELIKSVFRNTNTLGLLIHSLTDGIALATTIMSTEAIEYAESHYSNIDTGSLMSSRDISEIEPVPDNDDSFKVGIIIVAIFVHKLPTSFALTSLLLLENYTLKEVVYHLTAFSVSAPIGAFITMFLVKLLFSRPDGESASTSDQITGPLLLFSAGSFLYVGFHTLNEVMLNHNDANRNNAVGFENFNNLKKTKLVDNLLLLTGMVVPLITTYVHGGED